MASHRHFGPGLMWIQFDDLVDECLVDVQIKETTRGWVITDLVISLAPPEALREWVEYSDDGPRLSAFAAYPTDSYETIKGITSKHIEAISLDEIRSEIAADTDGEEDDDPAWTARLEAITASMSSGRNNRRDELFYAEWSMLYVDVTRTTRRGIYEEMQRRRPHQLTASSIRDVIKEARKRGILTRPINGRSGGRLTDKAKELLERNGR